MTLPEWKTAPVPSGWHAEAIARLVQFPTGQVDPRSEPYRAMVLVAPDHIEAGSGRLLARVTAADQQAISGKYVFEVGDVLYSKIRPYLRKAVLAQFEGLTSADMYPLRPRDDVDPRFLLAILLGEHFSRFAEIVSMRSGFPKINRSEFSEYSAAVPPFAEQRQIAAILETIDGAIRKTEQIIVKLKWVKQGLLHDLLTRGIDDNGELRDPKRHPEQFKDSLLGRVPKQWTVSSVEAEFEISSGFSLGPLRRPKLNSWPYLRVANVQREYIDLADVACLDARASELVERSLLPGDLLVVEGHANPEEIGRCAMVPAAASGFAFQNHLFRLRSRRIGSTFGLYWMNSLAVRRYWRTVCATSSGLNTINRSQLRAVPVPLLSRAEQQAIELQVDSASKRLHLEAQWLAKLQLIKTGLMDDLLTGRVRVTPLLEATP